MKQLDPLTLLCKEYVQKKEYESAIDVIDAIALVNPGRANAMYRFAFHRSVRQVVADIINYVRGSK